MRGNLILVDSFLRARLMGFLRKCFLRRSPQNSFLFHVFNVQKSCSVLKCLPPPQGILL